MASRKQLTLSNLKELDFGRIGEAFNHELQHVTKDCMDRPGDKRPRTVALVFKLIPQVDTTGKSQDCEMVAVGCEITAAVPKRRSKIYNMVPTADGKLAFSPDSPEDPDANLLFDKESGEVLDENDE